jgi:hypothetical protein
MNDIDRDRFSGTTNDATSAASGAWRSREDLEAEVERLREALQRIEAGLVEYVENGAECTMEPQDVLEIVRHALAPLGSQDGAAVDRRDTA